MRNDIIDEYFEWLSNIVCRGRYSNRTSFRKLLMRLHDIKFRYALLQDENRADDGVNMRYHFAYEHPDIYDAESYLTGPSSVLEVMIALAIRMESIMDDPSIGDRTAQWFWCMVVNLGLGSMSDDRFDKRRVDISIERFLDREYEPDGQGGLFTIRNCEYDARNAELWHQALWYLDNIT